MTSVTLQALLAEGKALQLPAGAKVLFVDPSAIDLESFPVENMPADDPLVGAWVVPVRVQGGKTVADYVLFVNTTEAPR